LELREKDVKITEPCLDFRKIQKKRGEIKRKMLKITGKNFN